MRDLEVTSLYDSIDDQKLEAFNSGMDSQMHVKTDYYKDDNDFGWVYFVEDTLPYVEKIFRNPKRFITTEEEIVKIESAKKVGVETVKHLAKHTNYIQDIDDDTGDVIPSKLLNVFKEETFNTYENRFVYTLILRLEDFIKQRKDAIKNDPRLKDNKKVEYTSTTMVGDEKVNVNIQLNTELDTNLELDSKVQEKIKKIEDNIKEIKFTEVYRALEKEDVALVTPPIKKTNVILKNVNFQYAMALWDYIFANMGVKNKPIRKNRDYMEKGAVKGLLDETFLLDYLTINNINSEDNFLDSAKKQTISRMLDRIIDYNPELTKKELQEKLGAEFDKAVERRVATKKDIEKIFRKYIDKYFETIKNIGVKNA